LAGGRISRLDPDVPAMALVPMPASLQAQYKCDAGLAGGLVAALLFSRLLASLLFRVRILDPLTFLATPLVLILAAAAPCRLIARIRANSPGSARPLPTY
jgi:hypothetical protein